MNDYQNKFNHALKSLDGLTMKIEVIGNWIWVSDYKKLYTKILNQAGFRYTNKKDKWFFCPPNLSPNITKKPLKMKELRQKYGRKLYKPIDFKQLSLEL